MQYINEIVGLGSDTYTAFLLRKNIDLYYSMKHGVSNLCKPRDHPNSSGEFRLGKIIFQHYYDFRGDLEIVYIGMDYGRLTYYPYKYFTIGNFFSKIIKYELYFDSKMSEFANMKYTRIYIKLKFWKYNQPSYDFTSYKEILSNPNNWAVSKSWNLVWLCEEIYSKPNNIVKNARTIIV